MTWIFLKPLGFKHYQGSQFQDDAQLRENYIDRIYDTYIDDEEQLQACDKTICDIADQLRTSNLILQGSLLKKLVNI